ncbi:heterokaryon incompatibility protein [Rutstroemia sp. NJR-2017a BBW]|nr:heterokaryon incompatibility protein [Rutstroemia sp. NJR-2017a BBW]
MYTGTPPILAAIKPRRRIHVNPLSKQGLSVAQEWISSCVTEHHECTSEQSALPKRLLSVGTTETDEIKVVSVEHPVIYAALSYCWGHSTRFETTAANKIFHMRAIAMSNLPRTFRDAITVTRCLGMKHIWIDALCIIQDDPIDVEEECSKMGAIFGGCKLAIIATQAQDSNAGFLTRSISDRCVIRAKYRDQPVEIYARESSNIPLQLSDCPVYSRGWCFQEMLLAPRSLHFGPREMVFRCRYEEKCECTGSERRLSPNPFANSLYTPSLRNPGLHPISTDGGHLAFQSRDQQWSNNHYHVSRIAHGGPRAMIENLYLSRTATQDSFQPIWFGYMWGEIVSNYSYRRLTFVEDTLTALSGISGFMDAYSPGRYLAGLWEKDLHYQLCWTSLLNEGHHCFRPVERVAPSFSWACRSGPVHFPFEWDIDHICHIVEMNSTLRTKNPFGSVQDGFLKLRTRLIAGIVRPDRRHLWCLERDETLGLLQFDCTEDEESAQDQNVYCCELLHCAPDDNWRNRYEVVALILVPGTIEGAYRRIGLADQLPPRWFKDQPYTELTIF